MKNALVITCLLIPAASAFSQQAVVDSAIAVDSGYIDVDGGRLFYETAGGGDQIVLIHDGILHRVVWDGQFFELAKQYRVVRYDRRSFGKSSVSQARFSHIDDLYQVFTQLQIDKAILFGMSAGGALAIDFTLKYPDKVNGLVLAGAVVSGYDYSAHLLSRGGRIKSFSEYLDKKRFIEYFGWEDPYEIYPQNIKAKEEFKRLLEANAHNAVGAMDRFQSPPERQAVKFLSEISVPTLILAGEYDIPDVHAQSGVINAGIPNSKREIISNAGHLIPFEQPEAFNASVFKFLNSMGFNNILLTQGVKAAALYFQNKHEVDSNYIPFEEGEMNTLAYSYLQQGKVDDAIALFIMNTVAFPNSANTYDSLGEAYMTAGNKELAIKNYERSLELNPSNTNAVEQLKKLRGN